MFKQGATNARVGRRTFLLRKRAVAKMFHGISAFEHRRSYVCFLAYTFNKHKKIAIPEWTFKT